MMLIMLPPASMARICAQLRLFVLQITTCCAFSDMNPDSQHGTLAPLKFSSHNPLCNAAAGAMTHAKIVIVAMSSQAGRKGI